MRATFPINTSRDVSTATGQRISFRRRLTSNLGVALAGALALLGALVWTGAYFGLHRSAINALHAETDEVVQQIARDDDPNADRYLWTEPQHLFADVQIDPRFLQVFDSTGVLLRESFNIDLLEPGTYPDSLLTIKRGLRMRSFLNGENHVYYVVRPALSTAGDTVAFVQMGRFDPGMRRTAANLATGLLLGFVVVLAGLLWLVSQISERVLRPLASITSAARRISPETLTARIDIPANADHETAVLAATLNISLDEVEQAFENMIRFTSDAAHELMTPLAVLRGQVDVALRRPRSNEQYVATLETLRDEVSGLTGAVRSMLTLARIDQQRGHAPRGPVDLSEVVAKHVDSFRKRAEERKLTVAEQIESEVRCCGQQDLLSEIVANLLDNALKYTRSGTVQVRLEQLGDRVLLAVSDTGIGIAKEDVVRVTERFFRASSAASSGESGSGLGLSIVRQIVEWHGGSLEIESQPDHGTTVRVFLASYCDDTS